SELMRSIAGAQRPGTRAWLRAWNRWHTMRATERRGLPRADAVLCVSEGDAEGLAPLSDNLIIAPNGVDDDFFEVAPEPPAESRIFFFGRLDYPPNDHGIARFLREGWGLVLDSHPDAYLRLAGAGGSAELQQLAARTPGVEYVGFVDDLMEELSAATLTVVPLWAGGGTRLKVLESLAAARPVVGTSLGVEGVGFESERHGLVADSSAGMAAAVTRLLDDGELRARLARQGRELAERFRWPLALAPVEELYRRSAASAEISGGLASSRQRTS
ncbi:MAG: glycosyltransferase, partial [Solirubrobacterales bacterium]